MSEANQQLLIKIAGVTVAVGVAVLSQTVVKDSAVSAMLVAVAGAMLGWVGFKRPGDEAPSKNE